MNEMNEMKMNVINVYKCIRYKLSFSMHHFDCRLI